MALSSTVRSKNEGRMTRPLCPACRIPTRDDEDCRLCWLMEVHGAFDPLTMLVAGDGSSTGLTMGEYGDAVDRWSNDVEGAHAVDVGRCTRCDGVGRIAFDVHHEQRTPRGRHVWTSAATRGCPCVVMQRLPRDLYRPALVWSWVDFGDTWATALDEADLPRQGIGAGVSPDAPDVPDWWRDPRLSDADVELFNRERYFDPLP